MAPAMANHLGLSEGPGLSGQASTPFHFQSASHTHLLHLGEVRNPPSLLGDAAFVRPSNPCHLLPLVPLKKYLLSLSPWSVCACPPSLGWPLSSLLLEAEDMPAHFILTVFHHSFPVFVHPCHLSGTRNSMEII